MAPRSTRPAIDVEPAPLDFQDETSQRLLDEMADALADALGEQMAIEYLIETGELKAP